MAAVGPSWRDKLNKIVASIRFPSIFSLEELRKRQLEDTELKNILKNPNFPLKLQKLTWP